MENYLQQEDLTVFGIQVATFPLGIKEAFDELVAIFGDDRSYYGVSWCADNGAVDYYAMLVEAVAGEAKKYNYQELTITKGLYHTKTILDWMSKTDCIKDAFNELTAGTRPTKNRPCIEWYKSDHEVVCMTKAVTV